MNLSGCLDQSRYAPEKRAAGRLGEIGKGLGKAWNWAARGGKALPHQAPHPSPNAIPGLPPMPVGPRAVPSTAPTGFKPLPAAPPPLSAGTPLPGSTATLPGSKPGILSRALTSKPAIGAYGMAGGGALVAPVVKSISDLEADAWKKREATNIAETAAAAALYESRQGWNRLSALLPDKNFLEALRQKGMGGVAKAYEGEDAYRNSEERYQRGQTSGAEHWNRFGDKFDPGWITRAVMNFKYPKV